VFAVAVIIIAVVDLTYTTLALLPAAVLLVFASLLHLTQVWTMGITCGTALLPALLLLDDSFARLIVYSALVV
jgi:TRAP-type mannitol/chloroaromatic compound transport system permease small subunit